MLQRWFVGLAIVVTVVLATPSTTLAGDVFLKVGLTVHPDVVGFGSSRSAPTLVSPTRAISAWRSKVPTGATLRSARRSSIPFPPTSF